MGLEDQQQQIAEEQEQQLPDFSQEDEQMEGESGDLDTPDESTTKAAEQPQKIVVGGREMTLAEAEQQIREAEEVKRAAAEVLRRQRAAEEAQQQQTWETEANSAYEKRLKRIHNLVSKKDRTPEDGDPVHEMIQLSKDLALHELYSEIQGTQQKQAAAQARYDEFRGQFGATPGTEKFRDDPEIVAEALYLHDVAKYKAQDILPMLEARHGARLSRSGKVDDRTNRGLKLAPAATNRQQETKPKDEDAEIRTGISAILGY